NEFWMLGISSSGEPGRKFFDQLARGNWGDGGTPPGVSDLYQAPPGEYLAGEPVFLASPDAPRAGLGIVEHLNTKTDAAAFLIFDAHALNNGPVARLPLRHRLHPGFHASFFHSEVHSEG